MQIEYGLAASADDMDVRRPMIVRIDRHAQSGDAQSPNISQALGFFKRRVLTRAARACAPRLFAGQGALASERSFRA